MGVTPCNIQLVNIKYYVKMSGQQKKAGRRSRSKSLIGQRCCTYGYIKDFDYQKKFELASSCMQPYDSTK